MRLAIVLCPIAWLAGAAPALAQENAESVPPPCVLKRRPLRPHRVPRPPPACEETSAVPEAVEPPEPMGPPLKEWEEPALAEPALPPMPPSRSERIAAGDYDAELRMESEFGALPPPPPAHRPRSEDEDEVEVPVDRLGPTGAANAGVLAFDAGGAAEGGFLGVLLKVGARYAFLSRSTAEISVTPTASLLAVVELGLERQGLGLETRVGVALVKPHARFFPTVELYALAAGGFAGHGFRADAGWLRLGLGLQFNFFTMFTSRYTVGDLAMAFFHGMDAYFRAIFSGGWGGGGGGGYGALLVLAGLIVAVVLPPIAMFTAMLATFSAMVFNVEVCWRPQVDARQPGFAELRLGVGF